MHRSLKLSAWLVLALGGGQAFAGLGQIQVKSALGQPLLAEVPLLANDPAEGRELSARLASSADFARANIRGGRPDIPLQFTVVVDAGGGKSIRITSSEPVNAPYLDLLLELRSAAGTSLQEVPLLLDPPQMMSSAPAIAPPRAVDRAPPPPVATAPPAPVAPPAALDGYGGPVRRGQTLFAIARQSAAGGSVNQQLLALKQANPEAFYRDNINALKIGVVLRMPRRADLAALTPDAASDEVRRQNQAWRAGASTTTTTAVADAATRRQASSAPAGGAIHDDRLSLMPAGGRPDQAGPGADLAALRAEQSRLRESLTALQQRSEELQSRLKDLEDINSKNTRLLSLKDDEIAALQRKLGAAAKPIRRPAAPTPKEDRWYMRSWAWLAGAAALLLLLLGLLGRRRKAIAPALAVGPLAEHFDADAIASAAADREQDDLLDRLAEHPDDTDLHLDLVRLYYERRDVEHFEAAAEAMYAHIADPRQAEWLDVLSMGQDLVPSHPLFAAPVPSAARRSLAEPAAHPAPDGAADFETPGFDHDATGEVGGLSQFSDDPVDTKLDLARAYLDMGDADGARAMLEEVIDEGSEVQRAAAAKLLTEWR